MKVILDSTKEVKLTLKPRTRAEAVLQQLYIIIRTYKGECPMYRDFGMDFSFKDMPSSIAPSMFTAALSEAIREYAPDVSLSNVTFLNDSDYGETMDCTIEVTLNE